jgi:hypothetical protein
MQTVPEVMMKVDRLLNRIAPNGVDRLTTPTTQKSPADIISTDWSVEMYRHRLQKILRAALAWVDEAILEADEHADRLH